MARQSVTIGVPRAMLFHKYGDFWKEYFESLGHKVVFSSKTNKNMVDDGINLAVDETCLSVKVYLGHMKKLVDNPKLDLILAPRIRNYHKNEEHCTKFWALYDIAANTFMDKRIVSYNVDAKKNISERKGLIDFTIENKLANVFEANRAYYKAKKVVAEKRNQKFLEQNQLIKNGNLNILLVGHSYNSHDEMIGIPIKAALEKAGVNVLDCDVLNPETARVKSKELSPRLYWTYNQELLGAVQHYKEAIDGIVFIVTFPCGPDSLVVELCQHKLKDIPIMVITVDELQGDAGMKTRVESFIDILTMRKEGVQ